MKEGLDQKSYDIVRAVLGLEPIRDAAEKGKEVTEKVRNKLEK